MKSSPRILVVDDDLGVIAAYRHVLEGDRRDRSAISARDRSELEDELFGPSKLVVEHKFDWRVHFVDQGEDAIAAVRKAVVESDPYSVVFLDVRMPPGLDGYETAQAIRRLDQNIHIVFVSAYADYSEGELSEAAGAEDKSSFLPKPVWPDDLKAAALELCRKAVALGQSRRPERQRA